MVNDTALTLEELQAQFEDRKRSHISFGDLRKLRASAVATSHRLGCLQGWVDRYLAGKATADQLQAALEASVAVTP